MTVFLVRVDTIVAKREYLTIRVYLVLKDSFVEKVQRILHLVLEVRTVLRWDFLTSRSVLAAWQLITVRQVPQAP